jgi:hypothetical protein
METLARMRYVESLLGLVSARASGLSGEKALWTRYDMASEREYTIMGAGVAGIELREDDTGTTTTRAWADIPPAVRAQVLEACRNSGSATETLWLGAYCVLVGETGRADLYFDIAVELDPNLRPQVSAARAGK